MKYFGQYLSVCYLPNAGSTAWKGRRVASGSICGDCVALRAMFSFDAVATGLTRQEDLQVMSTSEQSTQSTAARRSAEAEVRKLIAKFAPEHQRLVAATRRWLRKRLPTAHEVVYEYRDCFVVSHSPNEHGYNGVFAIRGSADGVRLYFNRGKGLPDPEKLLRGAGGQTRWVELEGASTLARPAVVRLFDEALARNRVPFAPTGRGPVDVRPMAKQRQRRRPA